MQFLEVQENSVTLLKFCICKKLLGLCNINTYCLGSSSFRQIMQKMNQYCNRNVLYMTVSFYSLNSQNSSYETLAEKCPRKSKIHRVLNEHEMKHLLLKEKLQSILYVQCNVMHTFLDVSGAPRTMMLIPREVNIGTVPSHT